MKNLMNKEPDHGRLGAIGHSVSKHTAEAGQKIHEEFDEVAPKVTEAASKAVHAVAHSAAERSRPIRAETAARGSAALSGLLGEVTPAQIERMSKRGGRSRGRIVLLLAAVGGVAAWLLWWKRSEANMSPWSEAEDVPDPDRHPVEDLSGPPSA